MCIALKIVAHRNPYSNVYNDYYMTINRKCVISV